MRATELNGIANDQEQTVRGQIRRALSDRGVGGVGNIGESERKRKSSDQEQEQQQPQRRQPGQQPGQQRRYQRTLTPWRNGTHEQHRVRRSLAKEQARVKEAVEMKRLYTDLSKLVKTAKKEELLRGPTPFGKKDVRRRLVDELFAIRVGQTPHKYQ